MPCGAPHRAGPKYGEGVGFQIVAGIHGQGIEDAKRLVEGAKHPKLLGGSGGMPPLIFFGS